MLRSFNRLMMLSLALTLLHGVSEARAESMLVFSSDFDGGVPPEFSGEVATESVQGFGGLGAGAGIFSGELLRNKSGASVFVPGGIPGSKTILTLTGLPKHDSIDLNFLLAIIDSWDGNAGPPSPDRFNVAVNGEIIFSATFWNNDDADDTFQSYLPSPGVQLTPRPFGDLGFNSYNDSAYNMGLDPGFDNIPSSGGTLVIEWWADGDGWQGGADNPSAIENDESWGIDNVEVVLNGIGSVPISLDVQPGVCPNVINARSKVLPVAILGTDGFNAKDVNTASIQLAGVAPLRAGLEDVAAPFEPFSERDDCRGDCGTAGPDGHLDLTLKFSTRELLAAIGEFNDGDCLKLMLAGQLMDGTEITGEDLLNMRANGHDECKDSKKDKDGKKDKDSKKDKDCPKDKDSQKKREEG